MRGNFLYRNNGDGTFTKIASGDIVADRFGSVYGAWGDYDNDGFLDLFVSHSSIRSVDYYAPTAKNSLYHNNGDGTFTKITSGSLVNDLGCSLGSAWGDYDNDGFLDLFVTNFGSRVNDLFQNSGNTIPRITIKCIGPLESFCDWREGPRESDGWGQTTWQLREISGGGGVWSQNDLRAHFGLGDATNVDLVRIEWPSGTVQELQNVAANEFHTVTEPGEEPQLTSTRVNGEVQLTLNGKQGSRYDIGTSTDMIDWNSSLLHGHRYKPGRHVDLPRARRDQRRATVLPRDSEVSGWFAQRATSSFGLISFAGGRRRQQQPGGVSLRDWRERCYKLAEHGKNDSGSAARRL